MNSNTSTKVIHRSKKHRITSIIILSILVFIYLVFIIANSENYYNSDFLKFYLSARFLRARESIYSPLTLDTIPEDVQIEAELFEQPILANLNPPILALAMSPLGRLSYPNAYITWSLITLAFGLLAVYLIVHSYQPDLVKLNFVELTIVLLLFFPMLLTVLSGQISTILLLLVVIGWLAARKGDDLLSGIALGIALSLKIFTGIFILVFIIQRRWKLLGWYLGTFVTINLVALFTIGWGEHLKYLKTISSVTWYSATWNASYMGFFSRIFGGSDSIPLLPSTTIGLILTFLFISITLVLLIWQTRRSHSDDRLDFDLVYSLAIVSMLLISPLGWIYYFVLLVIPLVVGWSVFRRGEQRLSQWLVVAAWILCALPFRLLQGDEIRPVDMFVGAGLPFYGLMLFLITLSLIRRKYISRNVT